MGSSPALQQRYFDAAHEILSSVGYGGLKLQRLSDELGSTTAALYHAFRNWDAFTTALLEQWERERKKAYREFLESRPPNEEPFDFLLQMAMSLQHRSEAAIRVWAGVDEKVAEVQRRVDQMRFDFVRDLLAETLDGQEATLFAGLALNVIIGFEQNTLDESSEVLRAQLTFLLGLVRQHAEQVRATSS